MLKVISVGIVTIFVLIGCGSGTTSKTNTLVEARGFDKRSTDIIYKYMDKFPKNVQVSIAKIEDGEVHYYGALNDGNTVDAIVNHTNTFMIGSISKVFTSTLLAQLVVDGKVTLDENIADKLPFSLPNDIHISYQQLANHSSGLSRNPNFREVYGTNYNEHDALDNSDILRYLKTDLSLEYDQNTANYSNLGVGILGYMLTHIENKSYENLLQERIFSVLSMHNSSTIRGANLVAALMPNDDPVPLAYKSAGGILSSVEDLYQFTLATFSDRPEYALTQEATFQVNNTIKMGLGWFILNDSDTGLDFLFHAGSTQGYRSSMMLDKENRNGIIVLSNLPTDSYDDPMTDLGMELVDKMYQ